MAKSRSSPWSSFSTAFSTGATFSAGGEGRGAQDDEEDEPGGCIDREEGGLGGHAEGARRGSCVLRQAQAVLRGRWCELRGSRGAPQGGDRVSPGGAPHPERGGHRVLAEVSNGCLTSFLVTLQVKTEEYFFFAH